MTKWPLAIVILRVRFAIPARLFGMATHTPASSENEGAIAMRLTGPLDSEGFPDKKAWDKTEPLRFSTDWRGENTDPQRATEVRLLWTLEFLFLKFHARYRTITVFSSSEPNGRRDKLWDKDVVEVFLQPPGSELGRYKEFEVAPNGMWIDLDIGPGELHDLRSGLRRRVQVLEKEKKWIAELAIPMQSLTSNFDPKRDWRLNFYRVEGESGPRFYSAWQPTGTPAPNFHVPKKFGRLLFSESTEKR